MDETTTVEGFASTRTLYLKLLLVNPLFSLKLALNSSLSVPIGHRKRGSVENLLLYIHTTEFALIPNHKVRCRCVSRSGKCTVSTSKFIYVFIPDVRYAYMLSGATPWHAIVLRETYLWIAVGWSFGPATTALTKELFRKIKDTVG